MKPSQAFHLDQLRIVAARPALNFVNTVDPREGEPGVEYIPTYSALVQWAVRVGIITRSQSEHLKRAAQPDRSQEQQALRRALTLREALYRALSALSKHRQPHHRDLGVIQSAFHEAVGQAQLKQRGHRFQWQLREDLDLISSLIALDTVELLESGLADRLRRCPGSGDCGWLFVDTSKNATRRWCSMAGCGNRAKARRHSRKMRRS